MRCDSGRSRFSHQEISLDSRFTISLLSAEHTPQLRGHFAYLREDSGRDGLHFMPFVPGAAEGPRGPDPLRFAVPVTEPGWTRCFALWDETGERIIGHADLSGGKLATEMHRCELGIAIEAKWCGKGFGLQLMNAAIEFARAQPSLEWMDLRVFSINKRAQKLYQRCGFVELGCVPDRFRIGDAVIDDILMALKLRDELVTN